MTNIDVDALTRELMSAYQNGQMVAPPSSRPGFDLDDAYAVEMKLKQWREAAGHKAVGRKVGYGNKAMWRILKLETLVWGHMYDDTVHQSSGNSAELRLEHARSLKIEPEIVFGLKHPITSPGLDAAAALAAVDWLAIGFEIIDCPYPEWKFQPSDFVASFGLHAALIIGERLTVKPEMIPKLADELAKFRVKMFKNGEFVEEGSGKNALRSPALCLAELGAAIAKRFPDEPLSASEIVSTGTLTAGHLTTAGDQWKVDVEGLAVSNLSLKLV
jgi:2-oxo-3-hexenedioate decarboxylase